jgi:hypothetical protein
LVELVPIASRPQIAVIVLTQMSPRGVRDLAKQNGAYECFVNQHTSGEDLDRAIHRAIAFVGRMPKEDRYRPVYSFSSPTSSPRFQSPSHMAIAEGAAPGLLQANFCGPVRKMSQGRELET